MVATDGACKRKNTEPSGAGVQGEKWLSFRIEEAKTSRRERNLPRTFYVYLQPDQGVTHGVRNAFKSNGPTSG